MLKIGQTFVRYIIVGKIVRICIQRARRLLPLIGTAGLPLLLANCGRLATNPLDEQMAHLEATSVQILKANCSGCHAGTLSNGGGIGDVANVAHLVSNGLIVPGEPDSSRLLQSIANGRMPKGGPALSASDQAVLRQWIRAKRPVPTGMPIYICNNPSERGRADIDTRRLTRAELANTVKALLGPTIGADATIQSHIGGLPDDTILKPGEFNENPNSLLPGILLKIAQRTVALMTATPSLRVSLLGACVGVLPITDACATAVINSFGLRAFRRPPTTAEASALLTFYKNNGSGTAGLDMVIMRMLLAPPMVFHLELGASVQLGRALLTPYEVASRLSYRLTGNMPDAALFTAAGNGSLTTLEGVTTQAERLVTSQESRARVPAFINYYTHTTAVTTPNSFVAAYENVALANLNTEYSTELNDFVDYIYYGKSGTFKDLMSSSATFARSTRMANILSTTVVTGTTPGVSNSHQGLLLRPALLASSSMRTSPINRGAHIRKLYLCDEFGSPDPVAVAAQQQLVGDIEDMSNRAKVEKLTSAPACQGCHSQINGLGYSFERWSQLGSIRTHEPIFDNAGTFVKSWPIETLATNPNIETGGPSQIFDARDLVAYLGVSRKAQACYAKHLFEYQRLRAASKADHCALSEIEMAVNTGTLKSALVRSVANEDIFWKKVP